MSIKLALTVAPETALFSAFVVYRDKLETSLRKAAEFGYDGIELALLHKDQVNVDELQKTLRTTGLEVPMISTGQIFADAGVSFSHHDERLRKQAVERFLGLMEVAAEFGSMINVGRLRGTMEADKKSGDFFRESMETVLKRSEELDTIIALEPVNRYEIDFLNSCADCASVIMELDHPNLKMMPDVFHMNIEDPSIEGSLWKYAELIGYVHLADSNRWAPGRGHLDFKSIIDALKTTAYEGWAGVEILPFPVPDIAAREAVEFLRKFI